MKRARALFLLLLVSMSADARAKPVMTSKALTSDVRLPDAIVTLAERNRALFEKAATSDEAFCEFVADSLSLLEPLDNAVNSATSPPAGDDDDSGECGAETAGAAVYDVEGGVHKRLQWKNLRSVASPASRPLVLAMQKLGGDDFGAWIDQTTDYGGCHRPERALPALKSLSAAWQTAPTCLREAFRANVVQTFTWMTEDQCFCAAPAERKTIQRQLAANARVLSQMAGVGAPFARKLRGLASGPAAHFSCNGPG